MSYFKSVLERIIGQRGQHNINIILAQEIDSLKARLAEHENNVERGERSIHPALMRMREETAYNHKM